MKRYQAVAFLLSTAMTVSSVAPVFGASNDVFGHWAELTITKWQNEGRIGGYEDGTFKPDKAITRAEFVRLLNSAAPTAFTSSASINFSDVKESDWFYADVAKAVGGRVASGFEDGTFRPGETVTRMQAAVFICNAKGLTPNEAAANNFTDAASIPSWAKGAVGAAVAAGYLSGYPDGSFGGSKGMTRAEAVSTLDRVLGGGSTTSTPSGEIDTSDRDKDAEKEDNRTAEAGNMVWTSGGSGGSSKKSSSSSSSSSSDKKTNNVTIRSQKDADDYEGKTLTGTTEIYVDGSGIDLQDIKFKGDVEIYADDTVAAAYIEKDTAVAAASSTVDIYFEGKTNVTGKITVIRNNVAGADQVVIRTRTPRALSASVLAKVATKIVGFEINRVEATAPVEIAEGAKVNTVEAGDNAIVEVAADASVDKVDVTGDAKDIVLNGEGSTDVTVKSGASADQIVVDSTEATVELEGSAKVNDVFVVGNATAAVKVNDNAKVDNVAVSDSASADVAVADKAAVNKVELSDTATAKVDVAPDAKVDTITSTSTGKTEVSGEGTVDKIEATDPSTVDTSNAGDNVANVDKKEETQTTPATTTITAAQLKDVTLATPETGKAASVTGLPTGVKQAGTNWTAESTATPTADEPTGGGTGSGGTGSGGTGTTTPTTKKHTATITLTADTGYTFDTTIDKSAFTDLGDAVTKADTTASKITLDVTADIAVTDPTPPEENQPTITITAPTDVTVDTSADTATTVDLSAELTNAGTIADGTKMTWTATGITDVKFGKDEATAVIEGNSDIATADGSTSIKMFVPKGQTGSINVTAKCTVDGKEVTKTAIVNLAARVDADEVKTKLTEIENAMKSDADSPVTVDLLITDNATAIGTKVAEAAEKLSVASGYDVTFAANDVILTTGTATVTGKFTVQQSGNTDEALKKKSEQDITVKVLVKKAPIETVRVALTKPVADAKSANATTTDTNYEVTSTTWKEVGGASDMTADDTFASGKTYQATVLLTAKSDYTFNATTKATKVTDSETTVINPAPSDDANTLTLVVTYAALSDGSDTPSGSAGFDDENNANTEIQLTSANLTAGGNITLATKGITNITGTITSQFTGYKKADDSTDSTVDGSKLDVTATVDKTSVKVTAKQKGNEAPVAGTYTYEIEIPAGGATIDDKGATNNAAIKTSITVVVENGGGGGQNDPAITSLKGKLTSDTQGTAGNAITVTKSDTAQTIDLTLVTENFAATGDGVVLEIAPSGQSTLSTNTGFMDGNSLASNKVSKTIDAATLNGAATQSLKVQVGADQTGSFTITAKIGESGDVAATATVTVTVNNGGGSGGTEITTVDALTVTVPAGATEVPEESTSLTVASGKGYTATLDWADASNEGKWVEGSNSKNYFKAGETYTATITLAPDEQNTFKGIDKVSVTVGEENAKDVTLSADTDNNKALTGTVDVTIADGTASLGSTTTIAGTVGTELDTSNPPTITVTLNDDMFKSDYTGGELAGTSVTDWFGKNLPANIKASITVAEDKKSATITFSGTPNAELSIDNTWTVTVPQNVLASEKTDGIEAGTITITVAAATGN